MADIVSKVYCMCLFINFLMINWREMATIVYKGRTIRKLIGGGGGVQKIYIFAQGKIKRKKIHARQLTLRNIHAMA